MKLARAAVAVAFAGCWEPVVLADDAIGNETKLYVAPAVEGLHWSETFDGDVSARWSQSTQEKYTGKFKVDTRQREALVGDLGFLVPEEAKHYGAATVFAPIEGREGMPFVFQFEARFQDGLTCGGSYMKLYNSDGKPASEFDSDTPYVIMFGPDKCGGTDKVHFILQHRSPKTGVWEEKHFKSPPSVPMDQLTHLYTLIISPDNSVEIHVDGEKQASGSLFTSMEPPVNPPKEIDDPEDHKPSDWVDEQRIDDPTASKPDDWDEDAPAKIVDPKATMPTGWVEDAEKKIPDPSSSRPSDWDDEEDGEWEPPVIDNPVCKVGCGKWEPPTISNPAYKGKWYAPKIDNPEYRGVWKARQVANPNYFMDESPYLLPKIDAVGIDIWTMSKGIMFDNVVVAADAAKAKAFADQSWLLRKDIEELQAPKKKGSRTFFGDFSSLLDFLSRNLVATIATAVAVLAATFWCCCLRGSGVPPAPKQAKQKTTSGEKSKDEKGKEEENAEKEGEKAEEEEEEEKEDKKEAKKAGESEGGLGSIDSADS